MSGPSANTLRSIATAVRDYHREPDNQISALQIARLTGGMNNSLYRCTAADITCCVKVYRTDDQRPRAAREWSALALLACHCPGLAPRPLWHADDDQPILIMEFVSGVPLLSAMIESRHLTILAERLAQLAALDPAQIAFPEHAEGIPARIVARLSDAVTRLSDGWSGVTGQGSLPLVRSWLSSEDVETLLGAELRTFCTGDPNLANWLWDEQAGQLRRVDLEYAGWDDRATDLADLIEGPWAAGVAPRLWQDFLCQSALDSAAQRRFIAARRMWACFWLMKALDRLTRDQDHEAQCLLQRRLNHAARLLDDGALATRGE